MNQLRITIWNEFRHEKKNKAVQKHYPDGIHAAIADGIKQFLGNDGTGVSPVDHKKRAAGTPTPPSSITIRTATLDEKEHGLTDDLLAATDVLTWWGHIAHGEVADAIVDKVQKRVLEGMGLVVLHSGHYSKIFRRLMGTGCGLKWREADELERLWIVNPAHPIADGLGDHFDIPREEMYGELFDVPAPDELILISWFEGGDIFRSGCTWTRGKGRIFYFRPGHETYPTYHDANVRRVIANGVKWAAVNSSSPFSLGAPNVPKPLSPIRAK